jgi:hypothetical protein
MASKGTGNRRQVASAIPANAVLRMAKSLIAVFRGAAPVVTRRLNQAELRSGFGSDALSNCCTAATRFEYALGRRRVFGQQVCWTNRARTEVATAIGAHPM